jgi:hypothetical protein
MTPTADKPKRGKPVVSYPFVSDKVSLARARSLWGDEAFAEIQNHKNWVTCRVGVVSGTTKVIYGSGTTWEQAFALAVEGKEFYGSVGKSR